MRRWQTWAGLGVLIAFCVFGTAVLFPIFASAQVSARMTQEIQDARSFSQAIESYTEAHQGHLPGMDWRERIETINPKLSPILRHKDGDWTMGFAAIPGTLGKKFEDLPPETILFVEYRAIDPTDVLHDVKDIGSPHSDRAMSITVESIYGNGVYFAVPTACLGLQLGRQNAPGLK